MGNVVQFQVQPADKFGYKRVGTTKRKLKGNQEDLGQLNMFEAKGGKSVRLLAHGSLFEQALILDKQEDPTAAEYYWKAIEEGGNVADAYCNLGILESKQGRNKKSLECFTTSLKHDATHFETHYNLANLHFDAGDYRPAKVHYELAREIDPTYPNLYFNLGLVLSLDNDLEAAAKALEHYLEISPDEKTGKAHELLESLRTSLGGSQLKN